MKKLFLTVLLFVFCTTLFCQEWVMEPDSAYYIIEDERSTYCNGTSSTYTNRYKVIGNYIPLSTHPTKTIKVNFNIMQRDDGSGSFSNTQQGIDYLNSIFTSFRNRYITLSGPSDPIAGIISLSFTKFDFELSGIYFYQNTTYFNSSSPWALNQYVKGLHPERMNELNIYFTGAPSNKTNATMPGEFYSGYDLGIAMCKEWDIFTQGGVWAAAGGICHEMGHCLNLTHPYPGGGTACSLAAMVAEEGWFADLFGEPFPGNAFHLTSSYNCSPPCDDCPPITTSNETNPYINEDEYSDRVTNNFMGNQYNFRQYLSPSQIGKAHRASYFSALRRYVKDDCYDQNNPIIVDSDETWDFNIRVYQDIIIEDGAECTFTCHVELPYNAKIIVRDGSTLIVDGSISGVNETAWKGQIEVEPGGELIIEDDGEILLGEGGEIIIDQSLTDLATLTYNAGGEIILSHNTSYLDIVGNLYIGQNAQFTFTGNGYIKFSNPGPDATYNITAGTGASMLFSGSGQSDKVLEIQQNTVHFPQLSSLTFEDCKIEMGTSKRMQTDVSYPVTFDNVKLTSTTGAHNNHRSFWFIGQSNVTINNCIFEYGQYGLSANLTYTNGSPLYITNSTFRFNTQGLNIYGKGLHLNNCNVINNTSYGVYCNAMSFTSEFIDCSINDNNYGIYYIGSASADVDVENTYIQSNNYDGIKTSGAFDVNMECAFINENRYGLYTQNGTYIKPYMCDISANTRAMYFNYGRVYLLNKYNQLQSLNDGFTLYGYLSALCGGGSPTITATHNRWASDPLALPIYYLLVYNCSPTTTINVVDSDRSYLACISPFSFSPPSGEILQLNQSENIEISANELPTITLSESTMPVDEAVPYLANQLDNINTETEYLNLIEQYSSLILNCEIYSEVEVKLWKDMAYNDLHNVVSDFYKFVNFNNSNTSLNQGIDEIIQLNKSLLNNPNLIYTDYVEYNLDIALLDRLRENYSTSITQLENLSSSLVEYDNSESENQFVQSWLCKIRAEKSAKEGLLTIDEFMLAIEECEICMTNRSTEEDDDEGEIFEKSTIKEDFNTTSNFHISPNPNDGSFTITLEDPCDNCEIRIINSIGQIVRTIRPSQTGLLNIAVDGLKTGHYTVLYLIDNEIKNSAKVVVKQ